MHRMPLDPKLENTIRNLKKEREIAKASNMVDQGEANQNMPVFAADRPQ